MSNLRIQPVAVSMILNETRDRFLLVNNRRWNEYALPMHKVGDSSPAEAALSAVSDRDFPGNVEGPISSPVAFFGDWNYSPTAREQTAYEYHVFEISLANPLDETAHPDLRWFSYQELQAANNVTESTKSVVKKVVEHRNIAVAIVTRQRAGVTELMLIDNPSYGLFPPASRIKDASGAGYWSLQALRNDVGFNGVAEPTKTVTVEPKENSESGRYPAGAWRQYELVWFAIDPGEINADVQWQPIGELKSLAGGSPQLNEIRLHLQ